jgi:NAD(P)-dependent dehydrogenase (short-subunit alcohol dehydrogenase family)
VSPKKVAIVTAASRGMGAACARELAEQDYTVVLMARSEDVLELAQNLGGLGIIGSVSDAQALANVVNKTLAAFGRIDAVVNNTGHAPTGELLEIPDQAWHETLDLLLLNVVRMARLVTPIMLEQGGGAFVNISTFSAFEPSLSFPVSSTLRAALSSFTKLYADRYASAGIRMNNILPGFIESYPIDTETAQSIPMRRVGTVAEIAKTVSFLLSDAASYINGQNIRVDGGLTRSIP